MWPNCAQLRCIPDHSSALGSVRAYVMSHRQFLEVRVHESVMLQLKSAMGDRRSADRKMVS